MGWVVGFYLFALASAAAVDWLVPPLRLPERFAVLAAALPLVVGALVATVGAAALRRNVRAVGWPGRRWAMRGGAGGIALGAATAAVALLLAVASGARWVATGEPFTGYLSNAGVLLGGIAAAALGEELLFRGFPLATLAESFGRVGAAGVLSLLFAVVHMGNPSVTPFGLANIVLASLVLSAAFFTPGALPAAWGLHAAWNGGLTLVDAPVSGIRFDVPAIDFSPGARDWLTGGSFGPEGGAAATVALGGALAWLAGRLRAPGVEAAA
jgi:hypothetical protein